MKTILVNDDIKIHNEHNYAVCLGMFDGVHLGHRELINETVKIAKEKNLKSAAVTFFSNQQFNKIYLTEQQLKLFSDLHLDAVFVILFDDHFKNTTSVEFIKKYLNDYIRAKEIICGFNYTFGKNKEGNSNTLIQFSKQYGYQVTVIPPISIENEIVSSTFIKEYLKNGKIKEANKLLGSKYFIEGVVSGGKKIGRTINFPTANIKMNEQLCEIKFGVYSSKAVIDGKIYDSISNIGKAPTISDKKTILCESFIIDYMGDLYNKIIRIYLVDFIRPEKKFQNIEELKKTISENVLTAKEQLKYESI